MVRGRVITSYSIHYTKLYDFSTEVTPGQVFHFNYSFEYEFFKGFRGAVAGYYLKQLTEDEGSFGVITSYSIHYTKLYDNSRNTS